MCWGPLMCRSVARWGCFSENMQVVMSIRGPRWTVQPAPISSQRWYNCRGGMERGHRLWSSSVSSFSLCTYSLQLRTHWLYSPPSLFHYPPPTTGQFVPPARLPPPPAVLFSPSSALQWQVLVRELPQPLRYSSKSLLPFPATFNLITGLLQLFRGGQSQEDNSKPSGFTNTLPRVIWFTRGATYTLLQHRVLARPVI